MKKPPLNVASLAKTVKMGRKSYVCMTPGFVIGAYLSQPLDEACALIADGIEFYVSTVGRTTLVSQVDDDGDSAELTNKVLARDLKRLRKLPKGADGIDIEYSSEVGAGVGSYGLTVAAHAADKDFERQTSLVRFEWPPEAVTAWGAQKCLDWMQELFGRLQPESANAGLGFKRASGLEEEATAAVNQLAMRFVAFDPCYNDAADDMRGSVLTAHWINLLDLALFDRCGGPTALKNTAPAVHATIGKRHVFLRNHVLPPVGDANAGLGDLGSLPEAARFIKPVRLELDGMGDDEFDSIAWSARLDRLVAVPWLK